MDNLKWCGKCKQNLPISQFAKNSAKKDGLQERCRTCRSKHFQDVGKLTRTKPTKEDKRRYLLRKYNLTPKCFDLMLSSQNGKCAVCGSDDWGRPSPSVDHDHATGKVRGLLCNTCNRALGLFNDSIELLKLAQTYLEKNNG